MPTEKEKLTARINQYEILERASDNACCRHLAEYYARLKQEAKEAYYALEEREWKRFQYAQKFV